jgi:hypothetical protein
LVIRSFLALVLLLHLRPSLRRSLIFGSSVGLALLPSAADGAHGCAYGRTFPGVSDNSANHRAFGRASSRTLGSPTFLLRRGISRLRLSSLDISRRRRLRSRRIRADACLLLSRVIAAGLINELLIMTLTLSRIGVKAHFICG